MRRPLFGNGFPQSVPVVVAPTANPDDCLQIMDLRSLNAEMQSYTRFITLFAHRITVQGGAGIYVQIGSETPYLVGNIHATAPAGATDPGSIRFPVRGNVRVFAAADADATVVAIFGYYELQADQVELEVPRPLQPSSPVSPFNVTPQSFDTSESASIHLFDEGYVDLITINYALAFSEGNGSATVAFPNGVALLIPVTSSEYFGQNNLMEGIPMLSDDSNQTIVATADAAIPAGGLVISGTFSRNG